MGVRVEFYEAGGVLNSDSHMILLAELAIDIAGNDAAFADA